MIVKVIILIILIILLFYTVNNNNELFSVYFVSDAGDIGSIYKIGQDVSFEEVGDIPIGKYVEKPYNPGSTFNRGANMVLKPITQCNKDTQYIKKEAVIGTIRDAGNNRECEELNQCDYESQYINSPIITNEVWGHRINDNTCADINSCGEYEILARPDSMPEKAYSSGTCVKIGDIIINIELANTQEITIKKKKYTGSVKLFNTIQSIKNYFSNLKTNEENYVSEMGINSQIILGIDNDTPNILGDSLSCYYKKTNKFVSYLLDLRNENVKSNILKKHLYLDISFIERITKNITGPLYLFIFGKTVDENIPMKLFNADNLVFALIYKDQESNDQNTTEYKYDLVKYDLNLFYEYNREYAISLSSPDKKYLEYFLKIILFSKIIPKYNINLYNKTKKGLTLKIFAIYGSKTFNITPANKSISRCDFNAKGETLFDCKTKCSNSPNCSNFDCNLICENCKNDNCLWNVKYKMDQNLLAPNSVSIKGFSGDKLIKLTWLKPQSPSEIKKYYIILSSPIDTELLDIYSTADNRDLCEYIIPNLINERPYNIHVITKNEIGLSKKSNKITLVPNINSDLNFDETNDSYSNSIENYYKQQKGDDFNISKQISSYERKSVIQDLKNIIKNDLKINIPTESYNINIF